MGNKIRSATVLAGSVVLLTAMAPMAAQANTPNEFRWCWHAPTALPALQAVLAADGPSIKQRTLPGKNSCVDMHVRPGQYTMTIDNGTAMRRAIKDFVNDNGIEALCGPTPPAANWHFTIDAVVKRQKITYTAHRIVDINFNNGGFNDQQKTEQFTTNVVRHHQTKVTLRTNCVAHQF